MFRRSVARVATAARRSAFFCSTLPTLKSTSTFRRKAAQACGIWSGLRPPSPPGKTRNAPRPPRRSPTPPAYRHGSARCCCRILKRRDPLNGTRKAASQSSCRRRAFKTGVRDLVAKLKIFRYEGERRLRLIADYANSEECRSVFIRRYFGEEYPPRCGTCDRCRADRVVAEHASPAPISRPKSGPRAQDRRQSPARSGRRRRQRVHS